MQNAVMNIHANGTNANGNEQDSDKLITLLITKRKYNGLNLACILLEQMIIDNKDSNVSWMRIVCDQFIELAVQLIVEPDYRRDVHWTWIYLLKSESKWKIAEVYNLLKNGLLMFHGKQKKFYRYLMIIRNFALHPSLNISPTRKEKPVELKDILYSHNPIKWRCLDDVVCEKETEKSVDQVLGELKWDELGQTEKDIIKQIITKSRKMLNKYSDVCKYPIVIERVLEWIRKSKRKYGVDVLSTCLAVTLMALYLRKQVWPLNTQLVSYCLLVTKSTNEKGRLLEILTGEGKSCVIAMVAATYALLGRTVDIVTSSPVLSQRDAEEWQIYFNTLALDADCNVEDKRDEDNQCYKCAIVYGTVETFARDILKTEFLIQDARKGRKCDLVIVDEVDSMLIDQGVQCTYLSHDVASIEMRHFEPILALIWMHASRLTPIISKEGIVFYSTEPEVFLVTLSRLSNEIDPLHILRLAEEDEEVRDIKKGFTEEYLGKDIEGQTEMLSSIHCFAFFVFARKVLHLNIDLCYGVNDMNDFIYDCIQRNDRSRISIVSIDFGLASVVLHGDMVKDRLTKMITDCILSGENGNKIDLPIYLRDYCDSRLRCWIDNAFLASEMQPGREYIVEGDAVYPVDYKSTGVIEANKKWGDGLQQFLEMKHGLPRSPLSLITNFLSNIDFLERYGSNIVGVSGTFGDNAEKQFMRDTFSVEFATIPTSKRRKLFELDGLILEDEDKWLKSIFMNVESAIASQRAVLVICEDIATADKIHPMISREDSESALYLHTKGDSYDGGCMHKELKPGDVVITTNLGARGTNFVTDDIVNKNGGLFVLVTFIPLNDRVEKQAFGRTGRRGANGSCQIIVHMKAMPERLRSCETVGEAKRLRDSIENHRLNNMTEVNLTRNKQKLFREYCELKNKFVRSNARDLNDTTIQEDILDETWAKWIQNYEAIDPESNHVEMVQELHRISEECSKRAKRFESDNIYHIMKFGAVRLMKGDFEAASKFYDQVIRMDPAWSAFAHYNKAHCTIQMIGDDYIRRAIDDLKATLCKLETHKKSCLFSEILHLNASNRRTTGDEQTNRRSTQFYTMMECHLFHHIDTQIIETIEKLERIDTMKGEVTTVRRDILDLIPGADITSEKMLQVYQQLGLLFTFNIDEKPQFCYRYQIVCSLVMLESVADIVLEIFNGKLVNGRSMELKDTIDAVCSMRAISGESLQWMSQCISRAINTGISLIDFICEVSFSVPIKPNEQDSSYQVSKETSQFKQFANSQARYILELLKTTKQEKNSLVSFQGDEILLHITNVAMYVSKEKIEMTIHEQIGKQLCPELCCLFVNVTSPTRSDLKQFVNCIRGMAQFSAYYSQLSDANFQTYELQDIAVELMSKSRTGGITATD